MRPRLQPYVSETNFALVCAQAKRPGNSVSRIVDDALSLYYSSQADGVGGQAIIRRLNRLTRQFDRLEQKNLVLGETLGLFVRYYMMATPPVPAERQDAAKRQGDLRFESFLEQLGIELQSGRRLLQPAIDSVMTDEADYFTSAELDRLHQPAPDRDETEKDRA